MKIHEARKIVYDFINVVAEGAPIVCDADRLKHPKDVIIEAFDVYIEYLLAMRATLDTFHVLSQKIKLLLLC